jgi:predicted DNA-binding transcriptional regulator AlpA
MTTRAAITSRLPVIFGLARIEAAAAIGVSATTFDALVADGFMPSPRCIGTRKIWDVDEIRAAFKSLPRDGEQRRGGTWEDVA